MNHIVIMIDDFSKWMEDVVPGFHEIYARGTYYPWAQCTVPLCGPNRGALWTGKYPHNTGIKRNDTSRDRVVDYGRDRLYPSQLSGHVRGKFGKLINGSSIQEYWQNVFPRWYVTSKGSESADANDPYQVNDNGDVSNVSRINWDENDLLGTQVIRFIRRALDNGNPFLAEVTPHDPHSPYVPAKRYRGEFDGFQYRPINYNTVRPSHPLVTRSRSPLNLDEQRAMDNTVRGKLKESLAVVDLINAILDEVDNLGIADSTNIYFTSDNGFMCGELRHTTKGYPYRGSLATPMLVIGPKYAPGVDDSLVQTLDIPATVAAEEGITWPNDGRELSKANARNYMLSEHPYTNWRAITTVNREKYIHRMDTGEEELYFMGVDPHELDNRAQEFPEIVEYLRYVCATLFNSSGDQLRDAEIPA